jgi:23S rRNA (adenine2503-C2)-methyltransferase
LVRRLLAPHGGEAGRDREERQRAEAREEEGRSLSSVFHGGLFGPIPGLESGGGKACAWRADSGSNWYNFRVKQGLKSLVGLSADEIAEALEAADLASLQGTARMRGRQIADWTYGKAAAGFEEMANLPAALRQELAERFTGQPLEVARHARSSDDVDKLLVHGGDGQVFECVLLPYERRVSCCLSSQVGCPMGCSFCATGLGGFTRNLSAGEIVAQYLLLQRLSPRRIGHVVFMGMGEPLLNFDELLRAIRLLHEEVGLSYRHITVSTVGIAPKIRELAKVKLPIHLALSLHSPFDRIRDTFMPVNKRWSVAEVVGAMKDYQRATGRKITIEYLLIKELTDTPDQAAEIARLLKGVPSVVNLIPFNYVPTEEHFQRPERARIRAFRHELESRGVNVTERVERGHDIAAACGQLAGQHKGALARRGRPSELPLASA